MAQDPKITKESIKGIIDRTAKASDAALNKWESANITRIQDAITANDQGLRDTMPTLMGKGLNYVNNHITHIPDRVMDYVDQQRAGEKTKFSLKSVDPTGSKEAVGTAEQLEHTGKSVARMTRQLWRSTGANDNDVMRGVHETKRMYTLAKTVASLAFAPASITGHALYNAGFRAANAQAAEITVNKYTNDGIRKTLDRKTEMYARQQADRVSERVKQLESWGNFGGNRYRANGFDDVLSKARTFGGRSRVKLSAMERNRLNRQAMSNVEESFRKNFRAVVGHDPHMNPRINRFDYAVITERKLKKAGLLTPELKDNLDSMKNLAAMNMHKMKPLNVHVRNISQRAWMLMTYFGGEMKSDAMSGIKTTSQIVRYSKAIATPVIKRSWKILRRPVQFAANLTKRLGLEAARATLAMLAKGNAKLTAKLTARGGKSVALHAGKIALSSLRVMTNMTVTGAGAIGRAAATGAHALRYASKATIPELAQGVAHVAGAGIGAVGRGAGALVRKSSRLTRMVGGARYRASRIYGATLGKLRESTVSRLFAKARAKISHGVSSVFGKVFGGVSKLFNPFFKFGRLLGGAKRKLLMVFGAAMLLIVIMSMLPSIVISIVGAFQVPEKTVLEQVIDGLRTAYERDMAFINFESVESYLSYYGREQGIDYPGGMRCSIPISINYEDHRSLDKYKDNDQEYQINDSSVDPETLRTIWQNSNNAEILTMVYHVYNMDLEAYKASDVIDYAIALYNGSHEIHLNPVIVEDTAGKTITAMHVTYVTKYFDSLFSADIGRSEPTVKYAVTTAQNSISDIEAWSKLRSAGYSEQSAAAVMAVTQYLFNRQQNEGDVEDPIYSTAANYQEALYAKMVAAFDAFSNYYEDTTDHFYEFRSSGSIAQSVNRWIAIMEPESPVDGYQVMSAADGIYARLSGISERKLAMAVFMYKTAMDNSHGYSQNNRLSGIDYDCSSLVAAAMIEAGYNVGRSATSWELNNTYLPYWNGATAIDYNQSLSDLRVGDIFWRPKHVAMYVGGGMLAEAVHAEDGAGATEGAYGDQTGDEIRVIPVPPGVFTTTWRLPD